MLGPRQEIYRASCNSVEVRLRVNPDSAWIVIRRPGAEPYYRDIADDELPGLLAQYRAIGGDPGRFQAFVNAAESAYQLQHEQLGKPFPDFFGATLQA
jgi:hypothetical protein